LKASSTKKGLGSLLVEYSPNDKVVVKIDPAQVKGMPHRRFNGLVGTVTEVGRRAVTVEVPVGHKVKTITARKEHLVRMEVS
jgi:large subunit ribosomal protein L21e